jgi:outer membrane protein assembly factor BamD
MVLSSPKLGIRSETEGQAGRIEGLTSKALPIIIMGLLETFHMRQRIFLKRLLLVSVILSLLFGCGTGKDLKKIEGNPETLYKEGLLRFNKKDYPEALKKFEELKSSFPDSPPYTVWAELKVGDCHFLKKEYVEAIAVYEEFKKTHPSHEEIPYVQFQIGMSHFNQMLSLDRDQTRTKKALSSFEYLIATYPSSLFTEKARQKVDICKKRLADHEFYIGNFYYKHGRFEAAVPRFEGLLEKFPKGPEEDETLYLLAKCYIELGRWEKAEVTFMKIVTEYPKSLRFKEARAMLDTGITEKKVSLRKAKAKESDKEDESAAIEPGKIPLVRFEEEEKRPVSLREEKKVDLRKEDLRKEGEGSTSLVFTDAPVKTMPPKKDTAERRVSPPAIQPVQEDRAEATPPSVETSKPQPIPPEQPVKEDRVQAPLPLPSADTAPKIEVLPDQEKRPVSLNEEKKVDLGGEGEGSTSLAFTDAPVKTMPPKKDTAERRVSPPAIQPIQEDRAEATSPSVETSKPQPVPPEQPVKEDRVQAPLPLPSAGTAPKIEVQPDDEKRAAAIPSGPVYPEEKENVKKKGLPETKEGKFGDPVDKSLPIDITSDKVEARWKENLVIFKGNVIARQKDMVIYADSVDVVTSQDGKGIDRVIAEGNVKVQQGLRVADCQKAVFHNLDQKLFLTGDPRVSEGGNIVLGDEIIFDIDKNRVEVKGGPSGRGKVKIQPGDIEKLK